VVAPYLRPEGDVAPVEWRLQIAASAGPLRAPFGNQQPVNIPAAAANGTELVANSASPRPLYVELRAPAGTLLILGSSSNLQVTTNTLYTFLATAPVFSFVLLQGERLFGREANGVATAVLVTKVSV